MAIRNSFARIVFAAVLAFAALGTAQASDTSAPATSGQRATAIVSFRVIIPEVLRFDGESQRLHATAPQTTRLVSTEGDRAMVTLARP